MNSELIYKSLCTTPQTRKIILKDTYFSGTTELNKLNKRLENLLRSYKIGCGLLYGLHRGEIIFFPLEKNYFIFVVKYYKKNRYFYTDKIKEANFGCIELCDCRELLNNNWIKIDNIIVCRKNIISVY